MTVSTDMPERSFAHENIRAIVRGAYDMQKLRIQMGNRIVATFKVKLGQDPGTKEEDLEEAEKNLLSALRESYRRITDGVVNRKGAKDAAKAAKERTDTDAALDEVTVRLPRKFEGDGVIDTWAELCLIAQYVDLERSEKQHFRRLGSVIENVPIQKHFLSTIRGVGPAMAGVIISELDPHKARYVSSFWKYAGLDVGPDGRGRSRRKEHLVVRQYTDAEGNEAERMGVTFNPFVKTKLVGVLGTSLLRSGNEKYRTIYDQYKHRLETDPARADWTKGRRHNASIRYIVKQFLADLWVAWRTLEGLPVTATYAEAKLGIVHRPD